MWQFAWMFNLIPDNAFVWITYAMMALGVVLYIASKLVSWLPFIGRYKLAAELAGIAALMIASYLYSGVGYREMIAELNEKVKLSEQKAEEASARVEIRVVEKVKVVEKKVEVVRTQIIKDKEAINKECKISDVAIQNYNRAIADPDEEKK
jgi:predicted membrane protein